MYFIFFILIQVLGLFRLWMYIVIVFLKVVFYICDLDSLECEIILVVENYLIMIYEWFFVVFVFNRYIYQYNVKNVIMVKFILN